MENGYKKLSLEDKLYNLNLTKQNLLQKKERLEEQLRNLDQKIQKLQTSSEKN